MVWKKCHTSLIKLASEMQRDLVLIVGLSCSGKTTLARLAESLGHQAVHADDYRYSDTKWTRRSLTDFKAHVDVAIDAARQKAAVGKLVVYESALLDIHDPESARSCVLESLLPRAALVFVIVPDDQITCVGRLIDRSIGRATGSEPPGSCPETSESRARMIVKFIAGYDRACQALSAFYDTAVHAGCNAVRSRRDHLPSAFVESLAAIPL